MQRWNYNTLQNSQNNCKFKCILGAQKTEKGHNDCSPQSCSFNPPLPRGCRPLSHQVAGHRYGQGRLGIGQYGLLINAVCRYFQLWSVSANVNVNVGILNTAQSILRWFKCNFFKSILQADTVSLFVSSSVKHKVEYIVQFIKLLLHHFRCLKNTYTWVGCIFSQNVFKRSCLYPPETHIAFCRVYDVRVFKSTSLLLPSITLRNTRCGELHRIELWGLRMCNFTWNRFPLNLLIVSLITPIVESTYLNIDMCKFESSQKGEKQSPVGWFLKRSQ